jgi:hypothetical protein
MNKIYSSEVKGVIVWFKLIKPNCDLKLKIFGHYFIVFENQKYFVIIHLAHSKPQKSLKLFLKWAKYGFLKWRGALFGLRKENQNWVLELKFFHNVFVQNQMYIWYYMYNNIFAQIKM